VVVGLPRKHKVLNSNPVPPKKKKKKKEKNPKKLGPNLFKSIDDWAGGIAQ
jgi:hypothetical protein